MSDKRIDLRHRPIARPEARDIPKEVPKAPAPRRETGVQSVGAQRGRLFASGVDNAQRTRHVSQAAAAKPAMLQVHGAPLAKPVAAPRPATDVSAGPATPVSPVRKAFDTLPPRTVRGDVRLMEHNVESWMGIYGALGRAKGDVDASYFIFQRDIFGMAFLGKLLEKANDGQRVRLMLDAAGDAFGKLGFTITGRGQDYLQELVNTGNAQVKVYHPLHKKLVSNLKWGGKKFSGLANNHDKLLRTEDTVITGGRNISKDYFTAPEDRGDVYRDTDVLIKGKAASQAFAKAFGKEWTHDDLHFKVYPDTMGNLVRRDLELLCASTMMDTWLASPPRSEAEKDRLRNDKAYRNEQAEALLESALAKLPEHGIEREAGFWDKRNLRSLARELAGYAELAGARHTYQPEAGLHKNQEVKVIDRTSAAVRSEDDLTLALSKLASGAHERILIQNPYVVLTKSALAALEAASDRGVKIDLLTNSPDSSDSVLTQAFFLQDWPNILARVPNMRIFVLTGDQKLHAKVATADDEASVIGSYNLDLLSEQVNGEIAAATYSKALAKDVRASFEADRKNPAHKIVEYTIERDAKGQPVLRDCKPVVTFGPNDHMSTWKKVQYGVLGFLVGLARKMPKLSAISGIDPQG